MFNKPRITHAILAAVIAVALFVAKDHLPPGFDIASYLCAIVFLLAALLLGVNWAASNGVDNYVRVIDAKSYTERVRVLEVLAKLNEGQLDALMNSIHLSPALEGIEPRYIEVNGERVPWLFAYNVSRFEDYLPPLRDYGEGSKERKWLQALTDQWSIMGYVKPAAGPYSARFTNRSAALQMYGLEKA
jgi:hypothetical protein